MVPAGHPQGYQDCFDAFVADTYAAIAGEAPDGLPTFTDGLRAARITAGRPRVLAHQQLGRGRLMPTLGTTLFSFTPDWRRGEDATSILERVAGAGCGPALEVIGHQAWRGFPAVSADDERAFRDAVDRLGLEPVALGVYPHPFRRPGAPDGHRRDGSRT